jgi:hypothetical protein
MQFQTWQHRCRSGSDGTECDRTELGRHGERGDARPRALSTAPVSAAFSDVAQRRGDAPVEFPCSLLHLGERQGIEGRPEGIIAVRDGPIVDRDPLPATLDAWALANIFSCSLRWSSTYGSAATSSRPGPGISLAPSSRAP